MKTNDINTPFDFDYWMDLASNDPDQFERERKRAVASLINQSPTHLQNRLRGLQWRIDMEIKCSKNSMDSCLRIHRMMMERVVASGGLVESLYRLTDPESGPSPATQIESPAAVIPFSRRTES